MKLEQEFELQKRVMAAENKGVAIGYIINFLKDYYLSYGVTLTTDILREDAQTIFDCAKERGVLDDMNVVIK